MTPEENCLFDSCEYDKKKLKDVRIIENKLPDKLENVVISLNERINYLKGTVLEKLKSYPTKNIDYIRLLDEYIKILTEQYEITKYIFNCLQLTSWNITFNFINSINNQTMLKLTGFGDPSGGKGEGFSFLKMKQHKKMLLENYKKTRYYILLLIKN